MPAPARIDHLVLAARTLAEGDDWVHEHVGAPTQPGGRHSGFGTHNRLVSLGDCYLEVLAIDPDATPPSRPRWFALDEEGMRARLAAGPTLIHWVAAVEALPMPPGRLPAHLAAGLPGDTEVLELARGDNRWRLTVPRDGLLPVGRAAPSLIHWLTPPPASVLPDSGVRLEQLTLRMAEPEAVVHTLERIGLSDDRITVTDAPDPLLEATFTSA